MDRHVTEPEGWYSGIVATWMMDIESRSDGGEIDGNYLVCLACYSFTTPSLRHPIHSPSSQATPQGRNTPLTTPAPETDANTNTGTLSYPSQVYSVTQYNMPTNYPSTRNRYQCQYRLTLPPCMHTPSLAHIGISTGMGNPSRVAIPMQVISCDFLVLVELVKL